MPSAISYRWPPTTVAGLAPANEAALGTLDASALSEGSGAYVSTYKETFYLTRSGATAAAGERVPALNRTGFLWLRGRSSTAWWPQTNWWWDPANVTGLASDENDGASPATPLLTRDEFHRRTLGRRVIVPDLASQIMFLNLMSDCGDNDVVLADFSTEPRFQAQLQIVGASTVVPVGVVTAAQAFDPSINHGNQITVPGFDFGPHVGRVLRLAGTSGNTSTVASIEEAVSLGVARLGEMFSGGTDTQAFGFAQGQTVEIIAMPKLPGLHVRAAQVNVTECKIDRDPSVGAVSMVVDSHKSFLSVIRCEMRGPPPGIQNTVYCGQFSLNASSIVGSTWIFYGPTFNTIGGSMINSKIYLGSASLVHHIAGFGGTNSMIYAYDFAPVRLHGNFHMFKLAANGVGLALRYGSHAYLAAWYYGSGNDPTSAGVCMTGNTRFIAAPSALVMDAGKGAVMDANDEPTVANNGGFSVPFASIGAQGYPSPAGTLTPRAGAIQSG